MEWLYKCCGNCESFEKIENYLDIIYWFFECIDSAAYINNIIINSSNFQSIYYNKSYHLDKIKTCAYNELTRNILWAEYELRHILKINLNFKSTYGYEIVSDNKFFIDKIINEMKSIGVI